MTSKFYPEQLEFSFMRRNLYETIMAQPLTVEQYLIHKIDWDFYRIYFDDNMYIESTGQLRIPGL